MQHWLIDQTHPRKFCSQAPVLSLSFRDYDGPTQLAIDNSRKPAQNSYRYVDATLTIPRGSLFSCCGMNLAFNRELVGPSMYFGLMGHVSGRSGAGCLRGEGCA